MARTIADDFDQKWRRILDTAADVFAEKGFEVATTTDVAVACGMSKSVLYHYHRSKIAILYTMLTTHLNEVIKDVEQAVDAHEGAEERFRAFLMALLQSNAKSRSKNVVLLNSTRALPKDKQSEVFRLEKKLVQIGSDILKTLNPPVMTQTGLRMPYTMFLFGLVNWTYTWYDPKGRITPVEMARRIADLFLKGFPNLSPALPAMPGEGAMRLARLAAR